MNRFPLEMIVSGGQTGVDRAALDIGLELGFAIGGFCPVGRLAEDGVISDKYPLTEWGGLMTRTLKNIRHSDGTLVLNLGKLTGGTRLTLRYARKHKPVLLIQMEGDGDKAAAEIMSWLRQNQIRKLNIAGPKESKRPGAYEAALNLLRRLLIEP